MATRTTLRGLVLTAVELKKLTDWPDALVEDYLNILNNLIDLANLIDSKSGIIKSTVVVSGASYQPSAADQVIFCNTDIQPIQINLPAGINGTEYRIINAGTAGNNVTIGPTVGELVFGEATQLLYDREVLDIVFNEFEGWS
jgi:hypothetical protein